MEDGFQAKERTISNSVNLSLAKGFKDENVDEYLQFMEELRTEMAAKGLAEEGLNDILNEEQAVHWTKVARRTIPNRVFGLNLNCKPANCSTILSEKPKIPRHFEEERRKISHS